MTSQEAEELCRDLLQLTMSLEKTQMATVHFATWATREQVMKLMEEKYGAQADLRKIEFGLFH